MKKQTYKIGQEIVVKEDFKINTIVSDKVITVKEGDKGFLNSNGYLNITTGKGRGKIVKINDIEVEGYDYENISKMIFKRLDNEFNLTEYLGDDYYIETIVDEIENVLIDIL